jgi:hypothetical protein
MNRLITAAHAVIACAALSLPGLASADAVTDWNEITVAAVSAGRPGPIGQMDIALVQIAVHDAVQAIENRYEPYHFDLKNAEGKRSAAVAAAAHDMLVGMFPTQAATLDATYYTWLADNGLTGDPGLTVGEKAAASLLPLRRVNPNPLPAAFVGGTNPGQWRPTPPAGAAMATPWMAEFDPFTLTSPRRFRADAPPALTSERYRRDYEEVKALGALVGSTRTAEQTDVAYFWTDNFFAQSNRALRAIATQHLHRIGDSARLFALANMAIADSVITSWDSKKHYAFWRPSTAINDGDNDGNSATVGDPSWQPLVANPNYPDYTSGANNVMAAMSHTLARFFGTNSMTFQVTSLAPLAVQKTRTYHRFTDLQQEVVNARVYLGIHFRFADVAARTQGRQVADWAYEHFLLPRGEWRDDRKDPND